MKRIVQLTIILLLPFLCIGQGFTTNNTNGNLIDANGNNFIMKGINIPLAWFQNDVPSNIANVRNNTGSNCVRIVLTTSTPTNVWQSAVQTCINNNMIPMVELHDVTGSNAVADLQRMADWWANATRANFLKRPEIARYVLINIANEWSDWWLAQPNQNPSNDLWRSAYISAVQTIRNAGITTTLVIDAPGYGQDVNEGQNIRLNAKNIMAADAQALGGQANLLFSIHMYCEWRIGGNNISILQTIKNSGIPIMVGEFGYQHATDGSCDIDEQRIMDLCQQYGVGWLAWSQKGNGGGVEYLDLCINWSCTQLSNWGNTVFNGRNGTKTAVTASVFLPNSVAPTVTITSPTNNSAVCVGTSITITATASVSSGSISKVDFYDGNTLLGTDNTSPYTYTWNNAAAGSHTIRAIATSGANVASTAATSNLTVNALPTLTAYSNINSSTWQQQANVELCEGGGVMFGPHPYDVATGWSWRGPNNFMATTREITLQNISPSQAGTYTATFTNASNCSNSIDMLVTVNAKPIVTIISPADNDIITTNPANITIMTNVVGSSINSVQFYNGNTLLGQDATAPYTYAWNNVLDGVYALSARATDAKACVGTSATVSVEVNKVTSIDAVNTQAVVNCFPNPFTDSFTIQASGDFEYIIYNVSGIAVEQGVATNQEVVGKGLAEGIYTIKIEGIKEVFFTKIVKQ